MSTENFIPSMASISSLIKITNKSVMFYILAFSLMWIVIKHLYLKISSYMPNSLPTAVIKFSQLTISDIFCGSVFVAIISCFCYFICIDLLSGIIYKPSSDSIILLGGILFILMVLLIIAFKI